ncbi:hypothetical protein [Sediminibacterium sp.]|uniref:hypothetical protein n=1 Tax=Sediminibacterium sp. TaxID=1917865 RepID=UPI003F700520
MSRSLTGIVIIGLGLLTGCAGSVNSGSNTKGYLKSSAQQNTPTNFNAGTNLGSNTNSGTLYNNSGTLYNNPQLNNNQPLNNIPQYNNSPVNIPNTNNKSEYVPFTRELQMKLMAYNVDIKRVQFYIDQKLTLTRALDSAKAEVASGGVRFINGKLINEIVIPAYTPGIAESGDMNGVRVSFENGNSFLFVPAESEDKFVIAGNNWDNGTVEIPYDRNIYRASAGDGNGNVADVRLVVKLTDINKIDKKTRVLPGRKLN